MFPCVRIVRSQHTSHGTLNIVFTYLVLTLGLLELRLPSRNGPRDLSMVSSRSRELTFRSRGLDLDLSGLEPIAIFTQIYLRRFVTKTLSPHISSIEASAIIN